mmetsp:Transcript_122/g.265  ORF Transcript_122/g.265 Transcript_122/m.265 type:complete len:224 (-) Transcript_122:3032-3703(-)
MYTAITIIRYFGLGPNIGAAFIVGPSIRRQITGGLFAATDLMQLRLSSNNFIGTFILETTENIFVSASKPPLLFSIQSRIRISSHWGSDFNYAHVHGPDLFFVIVASATFCTVILQIFLAAQVSTPCKTVRNSSLMCHITRAFSIEFTLRPKFALFIFHPPRDSMFGAASDFGLFCSISRIHQCTHSTAASVLCSTDLPLKHFKLASGKTGSPDHFCGEITLV